MNFKIVPNWKKAVTSVLLTTLALNGAYALVKIQIPNGIAEFSKNYVTRHNLIAEAQVVKEVPVLKAEDVKGQVNEAIKENLATPPASAKNSSK